jgi:FMN phosphatase YigB (HAD superfamily)
MQKMKSAGIDLSLFCIIDIIQGRDKKPSYKKIISNFGKEDSKIIVCGDKAHIDLLPAKQLDCMTVHMKYGRGINTEKDTSFIDFEIKELEELTNIIKNKW